MERIWKDRNAEWWLRRDYPKNSLQPGKPLRTFGEYVETKHPGVTRVEIRNGQLWQRIQAINRLVKEADTNWPVSLEETMRQIRNLIYPTVWDDRQILARLKVNFQNIFYMYLTQMPPSRDDASVDSYWEFADKHPIKTFEDYMEEEGVKYKTRIEVKASERVRQIIEMVNRYLSSAERARKYHDLVGLKTSLEQLRAFISSSATSRVSD